MKYVNTVALAGALVWLVGCATAPRVVVTEPVGPGPLAGSPGTGDGSLVIYSARAPADIDVNVAEWRYNNDFGRNDFLYEPAHTDYTIYTRNGEVFKRVSNARSMNDGVPTVVALPAGSYKVDAEALDCNSSPVRVLLTVVIKPGQTTLAHLDGGWNPGVQPMETEFAKLPCGRIIGWRAPEAGFASSQPTTQPN